MKNNLKIKPLGRFSAIFLALAVCFIVCFSANVSAFNWTDSSVVSYYKLDEASGTVIDVLGRYDGTNYGAIPNVVGKINTAYSFDHINDIIDLGSTRIINTTNNFTISLWFKYNSTNGGTLFGRDDGFASPELTLGTWIDNALVFSVGNKYIVSNITGLNNSVFHHVVAIKNGSTTQLWIDGALRGNESGVVPTYNVVNTSIGARPSGANFGGVIDEVGIINRTLNSTEILELYNSGDGLPFDEETTISVTLNSPANASVFSSSSIEFLYSLNITGGNSKGYYWKNATLYIWDSDNALFSSNFTSLAINNTILNRTITGFDIGNYKWNVVGYYGNATYNNYTSSQYNYTLQFGATAVSIGYNNQTFETARETFMAEFNILNDSEISLIQLIYNGSAYTITNISQVGSSLIVYKTIDIPLNINATSNQTNEFYFRFTYGGSSIQTTSTYEQNSSFINLINCSSLYNITALNFTLIDETTLLGLDPGANPISFEAYFIYWLGSGGVYKNYSFQDLNTSSTNNFRFCIYPYLPSNYTFRTNMDNVFSAEGYSENEYYLRNATLTNISADFDLMLFLLDISSSTKFYVKIKQGIDYIEGALVNIAKFFTGEGIYKTVAIKITDDAGSFPFYADIDGKYLWTVTKNGQVLGVVEKVASCAAAPCTLEINLEESIASIFSQIDEYYASNIVSNISFNPETNIVTYVFVDTTGLANYFRFEVRRTSGNLTAGTEICDLTSYTSAGVMTCNVTGYTGDFIAYGYISRSPELIDKIFHFFISDALSQLGLMGILLNVVIIVTMVFVSGVISRGNPGVVFFMLGVTILLLKIGMLFPFSWAVVVSIEVGIIFLLMKVKA